MFFASDLRLPAAEGKYSLFEKSAAPVRDP